MKSIITLVLSVFLFVACSSNSAPVKVEKYPAPPKVVTIKDNKQLQQEKQENQKLKKTINSLNGRIALLEKQQEEQVAKAKEEAKKEQALLAQAEIAVVPQKLVEEKAEIIPVAEKIDPEEVSKSKFALRIISLEAQDYYKKMAAKIVAFLEEQGIENTDVRQVGQHLVIDINGFDSINNSKAKEFQEKIRTMKYQGIQQFKDAYFINGPSASVTKEDDSQKQM